MKRYNKYLAIAERALLTYCEVVCCTCSCAMDPRLTPFTFENVLIDEATQAREPECLIPIVNGCKHLILVGDHQQLGPVILNQQARRAGFNISLFERLLSLNVIPIRLNVQYRMHPALSEFCSNMFYDGMLQNGLHASERTRNFDFPWPRSDKPMMFWAASGSEDPGSSGRSLQNRVEANYVEATVARLLQCGVQGARIGVITPYDSQRSLLMRMFSHHSTHTEQFKEVEVASVDEFQGREKDYIVFSCVRSNSVGILGFLTDYRRMNVALTRAKYGVVVVGDPNTLKNDNMWLALLAYYQREKCLVCGAALFPLHRQTVLLSAEEGEATLLGVSVGRVRLLVLTLATLSVAAVVSLTGLISFIGLLAPHGARLLMKGNRKSTMLLSGLLGGCLLCAGDIFARSVAAAELPVSVFTSLIGAPALIYLTLGRRDEG